MYVCMYVYVHLHVHTCKWKDVFWNINGQYTEVVCRNIFIFFMFVFAGL